MTSQELYTKMAELFETLTIEHNKPAKAAHGRARKAAGEYDGGAKVWMLMETPMEMTIADDPHSAFLLARTSHDGSSSVIIKPVIERLFCMNQINKIYKGKNKYTYQLSHTTNAQLSISEIRNIIQLSADSTSIKFIGSVLETLN